MAGQSSVYDSLPVFNSQEGWRVDLSVQKRPCASLHKACATAMPLWHPDISCAWSKVQQEVGRGP